jgi:hypothetical protein
MEEEGESMSSLLGEGGVVVVEVEVVRGCILRNRDRRLGRDVVDSSTVAAGVVDEDLGTKRERSRKSWLRAGGRLGEEDLGTSTVARTGALKVWDEKRRYYWNLVS